MANPNGLNPTYPGVVNAVGFDNLNSSGVCVTAVDTDTTTRRYVFSSAGNGFRGTVTGVWLITKTGTTATMTLACEDGTVCTINTSTSAGTLVGASSLSNTTIDRDGTLGVVLSGDNGYAGSATVFVTYAVEE
jgi:hypothetical protein